MKKLFYVAFFAVSFFIIWNTGIVNRTEADDAFEYAYQVEQGSQGWLYHSHHLLYGAMTKGIYEGAVLLGYGGRAYPVLRLISALCGAGVVLMFFRFCYRRFSMRPISSLLCSGLLLFSYGFWRYANEAEVIVPACFFMLCALYVSVAPNQTARESVLAGVMCGVSVLFHIMNAVPVFVAVPLFYLLEKEWKGMLINLVSAVMVVFLVYAAVFQFEPSRVYSTEGLALYFSWSSFPKAFIGFSQCVVSFNFLLGFQFVRDALVNLFPTRMLLEEIYMGRALTSGVIVFSSINIVLLAVCFVGTVIGALCVLMKREDGTRRRDRLGTAAGWEIMIVALLWFAGYAGLLILLEPGNPEVWVMGLVPFWLTFCGSIVAPLSRQNQLWPVLLIVVLLGLQNYAGGMRTLQNPVGDYNRQKARWVLSHAKENDLILTADNPVFERYLRYYSPAEVEHLHAWNIDRLNRLASELTLGEEGQRIFLMGDVFDVPVPVRNRFSRSSARIEKFAEQIEPFMKQVVQNEFNGVYVCRDQLNP